MPFFKKLKAKISALIPSKKTSKKSIKMSETERKAVMTIFSGFAGENAKIELPKQSQTKVSALKSSEKCALVEVKPVERKSFETPFDIERLSQSVEFAIKSAMDGDKKALNNARISVNKAVVFFQTQGNKEALKKCAVLLDKINKAE